jgi:hypothetical protein
VRARQASYTAREAPVREAAQQAYGCCADAEAAATKLRARQSAEPRVAVRGGEPPTYGPGRPRQQPPRAVQAWREGLQVTRHAQAEVIARTVHELGCLGLLTHVPTEGRGPIKRERAAGLPSAARGGAELRLLASPRYSP